MLGPDERLTYDAASGRWRARIHEALARPIGATRFVVFDLETTGGGPSASGITEIGAVRVVDGRLTDTFVTLVNPRQRIPPFVTRLTGITDEMVAESPPIAEALPAFLEWIGDDVAVAHNAAFDVGHLDAAQRALSGTPFDRPSICTLRLARRLLPGLRRRSLDSVAGALGISCWDRHRALPDARIAAEILCVFLERLAERNVTRLDDLLEFQRSAVDGRPFVVHVPRARLDEAPMTPGVYHLLGNDGRLLYVGKAVRLRERLASYFTNARGHSSKTLALIRQVYDFRVTETGSELGASLLEARQIRELRPPFNRAGRHLPRVGFLKVGVRSTFPRLWITERLGPDRAVYVGPFRSRESAERAQGVLARLFGLRTCAGRLAPSPDVSPCLSGQVGACTAPCAGRIDEPSYRARVDELLAFLEARSDAPIERATARRDVLASELRFEAAARAQRDLETLAEIRRRQETLAWVVAKQNFVVLLPSDARDAAALYAVLGGRLALETRITATADLLVAVRFVEERFARYQDLPLGRDDVDGTTIIAAWLRDRGARDGVLLPLDGPESLRERLDELVVTVRDLALPGPLPSIELPREAPAAAHEGRSA
jgi:DNA polymerase-3 subunit epsilon